MINIDTMIGIGIGLIPIVAGLLIWLLREKLGWFRRVVRWGTTTAMWGRTASEWPDRENRVVEGAAGWKYLVLEVPAGPEPVKDLTIHFDDRPTHWESDPKIVGGKLEGEGKDATLSFKSIERGRYVICVAGLGRHGFAPVPEEVTASNAKCARHYAVELRFARRVGWIGILGFLNTGAAVFWILTFISNTRSP